MTVIADALDLSTVQILRSPNVHDWPVTAAITRLEFRPNDVRVSFTKQDGPDRWPDAVTPGWDGPLQYTLWVILPQQKLTCGCIQFWHGREGVGGPFSKAAQDWWFRVPEMAAIQPQPGDRAGFFVTAGDARLRTEPTSVHERSNIVLVTIPPNDSGVLNFAAVAQPPDPAPTLNTGGQGDQGGGQSGSQSNADLTAVLARLDTLETELKGAVTDVNETLKAIAQKLGLPV